MKRNSIFLILMVVLVGFTAFAQKPSVIIGAGIGDVHFREPYHQNFNRTLSADTVYILTGWYFVDSTYEITIPAGTLIRGDSASAGTLIINRGARIYAEGTPQHPIVFTSNDPVGGRQPGDWGGVIILGQAPTNQVTTKQVEGGFGTITNSDAMYGGSDPDDNSGIFRYVRIEFAGSVFSQDNESNGLTLGGVGRGTTIDHIQVSFGNDDDYEFFGGTVDAKYLVSWRTLDDTYDSDFGWAGRLQFIYTKRDPLLFDASAPGSSNGFESDNEGASPYTATPRTKSRISNATIVGPQNDTSTSVNAKYQYVAMLRRATEQSIYNSILMGYPRGIQLRDTLTQRAAIDNRLEIRNTSLQSLAANLLTLSSSPNTGNIPGFNIKDWFDGVSPYTPTGNNGSTARNVNEVGLPPEVFNLDATNNPVPLPGSEPAIAGTSFDGRLAGDSWFESVSYRGAFDPSKPRSEQWDAGWTEYEPEKRDYDYGSESIQMLAGWNMISLPYYVDDNSKTTLFPDATSDAFYYDGIYQTAENIYNNRGYWIKYPSEQNVTIQATQLSHNTFAVTEGWNLIGSVATPIPVTSITSDPPGMITSSFFGYEGSYVIVDTIRPGKGYWVKTSGTGNLYLSTTTLLAKNAIRIVPTDELPPAPPDGNVTPSSATPEKFSVKSAYPNPFNPTTRFTVEVPELADVQLAIYNVLGQKVKTLMSGEVSPGSYEMEWDGTDGQGMSVPSGIYFIRMSADDFKAAQKIMLMK